MKECPVCRGQCSRDEVDIGVGTQYGPWRCGDCGWTEDGSMGVEPIDIEDVEW